MPPIQKTLLASLVLGFAFLNAPAAMASEDIRIPNLNQLEKKYGPSSDFLAKTRIIAEVSDGNNFYGDFGALMQIQLMEKHYAVLETVVDEYGRPQLLQDGASKATALDTALSALTHLSQGAEWWAAVMQEWRTTHPNSTARALIEAHYAITEAWSARGRSFNAPRAPLALQVFQEQLARARGILKESEVYAAHHPLWHQLYLRTYVGEGQNREEALAAYKKAALRFPDYEGIPAEYVRLLTPRWGGTPKQLLEFTNQATATAKAKRKSATYAWLNIAADDETYPYQDLLRQGLLPWARLKESLLETTRLYPKSLWHLNHFASLACRINDKATYLKLRPKIGQQVIEDAWPQNLRMELCDVRFGSES